MKAFITGASGFIGVPLVRELLKRGHEVVAWVRDPNAVGHWFVDRKEARSGQLHLLRGDLFDLGRMEKAMQSCDTVFHLAGRISYKKMEQAEVRQVNVLGTQNVLTVARKVGVSRFVHASSVVAVGVSWDPQKVLNEEASYNVADLHLEYFDSKKAAEAEVLAASRSGLTAVVVNPGVVVGFPEDHGPLGSVSQSLRYFALSPILPPGGNAWIDVRDVVEGLLLAWEKGRSGERYILTAENLSNLEVGRRLAASFGKKMPRFCLPKFLVQLFRRIPLVARVSGFYLYFDSNKAKRELGWTPRSPWPALEKMAQEALKT